MDHSGILLRRGKESYQLFFVCGSAACFCPFTIKELEGE